MRGASRSGGHVPVPYFIITCVYRSEGTLGRTRQAGPPSVAAKLCALARYRNVIASFFLHSHGRRTARVYLFHHRSSGGTANNAGMRVWENIRGMARRLLLPLDSSSCSKCRLSYTFHDVKDVDRSNKLTRMPSCSLKMAQCDTSRRHADGRMSLRER
jgi:hypothetical protein